MSRNEKAEPVLRQHESNGKYIIIKGVKTFYLDAGIGPVVFCTHGVPNSSLPESCISNLRGLRAIAIDLSGLGLSDRPEEFK